MPLKVEPLEEPYLNMTPMVDVILNLLIFFMLTASGVAAATLIPTPPAEFSVAADNPETVVISMNLAGDADTVVDNRLFEVQGVFAP